MVTNMERISRFVRDYISLMAGRPLIGTEERPMKEQDGLRASSRFLRGNIAGQDHDGGRVVTDADLARAEAEVAKASFRN